MKHTTPDALLISIELLRYVRDTKPTLDDFQTKFGEAGGQTFHVLRKAGVIVVDGDRVRLSRRHLSPDGTYFVWGCRMMMLDLDIEYLVRWGPQGPPVFAPDP